ncbi:MAG: hypothetical protein FJY55_06255 [Betaproteobacteria bacterium]|nr:hypothetical protein [Betaproteobacteria bacterium]
MLYPSPNPDGQRLVTEPEESLRESAPVASGLAQRLCGTAPAGGERAWNHWQYPQLIDLVTTPVHESKCQARLCWGAFAARRGALGRGNSGCARTEPR